MAVGRCVSCKNVKTVSPSDVAGGPICRACYRRNHAPRGTCSDCERPNMILDHKPDGVPLCDTCYKRAFRVAECASCKNVRRMEARDERGRPLCQACYERDYKARGICVKCTELRPLMYLGTTCRRCYHKYINIAPCSVCGHTSGIAART